MKFNAGTEPEGTRGCNSCCCLWHAVTLMKSRETNERDNLCRANNGNLVFFFFFTTVLAPAVVLCRIFNRMESFLLPFSLIFKLYCLPLFSSLPNRVLRIYDNHV